MDYRLEVKKILSNPDSKRVDMHIPADSECDDTLYKTILNTLKKYNASYIMVQITTDLYGTDKVSLHDYLMTKDPKYNACSV